MNASGAMNAGGIWPQLITAILQAAMARGGGSSAAANAQATAASHAAPVHAPYQPEHVDRPAILNPWRKAGRAVGTAAATYFGGAGLGSTLQGITGGMEHSAEKDMQEKLAKIRERNQQIRQDVQQQETWDQQQQAQASQQQQPPDFMTMLMQYLGRSQ